jgi:hypothetical protein
MRTIQDIVFGVAAQKIYFDAPEGRASAVTSVSVFPWDVGDDDTIEAAVGAGSIETDPNTTLDAAAGPSQADPRNIPLTATTGLVAERRYLVTHNTTGVKEWVEVQGVTSGDSCTVKHPLHNDFASGSTFQSTRLQATIDSTWIADEENLTTDVVGPNPAYRVRWVYVAGGVTYVADSYFNVVRYAGRHGVLPQDVEALVPGWLDSLPTDHRGDQGRKLIEDAYREVRIDMHQIDLTASSLAESEIVDELVRYKVSELSEMARYFGGSGGDIQRADAAQKRYQARLDALARIVSRIPVRDSSGAATAIMSVGLTRR